MSLETYRTKRDFGKSPEPKGSRKRGKGQSFVMQKHEARRLHYDLRLEIDGVLKSWAVTRGPSLVPGDKRLAVHVEDHPLDYGEFEGTIPKGEYGGGTVLLWDRGTWKPIGDAAKGYAKGHMQFELVGQKLNGRWHLVRMASKPREKRENWLLIKGDDEHAREEGDADILEERPESVKSGRRIEDIEGEQPGWSSVTGKISRKTKPANDKERSENPPAKVPSAKIKGARKGSLPDFVAPALAQLKPQAPSGDRWVHEIKFDGYRIQARLKDGKVRLLTRSGLDWTDRFGKSLPETIAALPAEAALIDGEIVVESSAGGASDFSALQADLSEGRSDRFVYYAFDLIHFDGQDLRGAGLTDRKAVLERLVGGVGGPLRFSEHFEEDGDLVLRHACRLSLEGVVSKTASGTYKSGRGRDWVKSKCADRQEFVIGGFVISSTSSKAIGSLVLGYFEDGKLRHAGRVGTGFKRSVAEDLFEKLKKLQRKTSPFDTSMEAAEKRGVRFVKPELVAEVEFRAWTAEGKVRHASFRGLREDKPAKEIGREDVGPTGKIQKPASTVKLTHPDRVYWPEAGVTKEGLADYYSQFWPLMAPHLIRRPLALLRCPSGITGQCFFQKHAWKGMNREVLRHEDPNASSDDSILGVDGLDGLIGLVQAGTLEIHTWQAGFEHMEQPDQIVMDLDPGDGVAWTEILAAAHETRERLEAAGLVPFVKLSGGKGIHVVAPLKPAAGWDEVKGFAKGIANAMASDSPERFVATVSKSKRKGKILVDYLRNGRGATAIAPYSSRARDGAPVSMPLSWEELGPDIGPTHFTVENAPARVASLSADPWEEFDKARARLVSGRTKGRR